MSFTPFRFATRARAPRKILLLAGPMLAGLGLVAALPAPPAALAQAPAAQTADTRAFSPEQKRAIEEIVKDYLIANPEVFLEVQQSLEAKMETIQAERIKAAIAQNARDIYHSADAPVAGNPKGDITVVEFFDYNCGY
jgi:protein-disulfide isomerase